jgi:hypothetical protein
METKNHNGIRYRFHSTLDGAGFWMPEPAWSAHGMRDFFTAEDGIEWTQGLPADFFGCDQ